MKYLFIHIPKTAGVKVRHNIHMNVGYPAAKICVQEEGADLRYWTDDELSQQDLISGHFGFALRRRLDVDRKCITFLRRPLERVISTYYYWKTLSGTLNARIATDLSIYEFAESQESLVTEYLDNAQTWQLFWDYSMAARVRFAHLEPPAILAQTMENLRLLDFVGIQEDLPQALEKMKRKFSWQWTDESDIKINKTPEYDLGQIDLDLLRNKVGNRLDMDESIYEFATELYFNT